MSFTLPKRSNAYFELCKDEYLEISNYKHNEQNEREKGHKTQRNIEKRL